MVGRKVIQQTSCHDAQQMSDARVMTPARETAVIGADEPQRVPLGFASFSAALPDGAGAALALGAGSAT